MRKVLVIAAVFVVRHVMVHQWGLMIKGMTLEVVVVGVVVGGGLVMVVLVVHHVLDISTKESWRLHLRSPSGKTGGPRQGFQLPKGRRALCTGEVGARLLGPPPV